MLIFFSLLGALAVLIAFLTFATSSAERWIANADDKRLTRALVLWTAVLAIATVVGAIFAGLTLDAIRGQLVEMQNGAEQTRQIITSYQNIATSAAQLSVATQRPWVSADVSLAGPLTYDGNGANISLELLLTNSGHTPALYVWPWIVPYLLKTGRDPRDEQKVRCDEVRNRPFSHSELGVMIAAQQTFPITLTTTIRKDEIEGSRFQTGERVMSPIIVGCVNYQFTFGERKRHQTGFIYKLDRIKPDQPGHFAIFPDDGDVPAGRLVLVPWVLEGGGFYAD